MSEEQKRVSNIARQEAAVDTRNLGNNKKSKLVSYVAYIVLAVALLFLLLAGYWLLAPFKTADIQEPIKVLNSNKLIAPNETILMELHITKYNLYPVVGANSIYCSDGRLYLITPAPGPRNSVSLPIGTYTRIVNNYNMPDGQTKGTRCHFIFSNRYQVNPIRYVTKTWTSENWTVE